MKDNFSHAPDDYARYRPGYPDAFFAYLSTLLTGTENAWDCATGNGQAAQKLAPLFKNVYATDISQEQLRQAVQLPNIHYSIQPAEKTDFASHFFDLVMVAQAVHWFDFEKFYTEVRRTAKPDALLVVAGYGRIRISPELDAVIDHLYHEIVGPYWDKERRYIDEHYQTIPFPFEELTVPLFSNRFDWTVDHLIGYLHTWSAVKHYRQKLNSDPLALVEDDLKAAWGQTKQQTVQFPLLLRIGKISRTG